MTNTDATRVGHFHVYPIVGLHLAIASIFLSDRSPGTAAARTSFPLDDSWIHLVYARNLAAFEGFAYNPGQLEAGFTSPLWTLLVAPVFWIGPLLGGDPIPAVKALGILVAFGCSLLAVSLVTRLTGRFSAGIAAGVLIAASPTFAFAAVSGMEVVLASGTVLLSLLAISRRRLHLAGFALALVPLARPENALFLLIAAPVLVRCLRESDASRWTWFAAAAPSLVAGAAWLAYCVAVTGRPLPTTFYVKSLDGAAMPVLQGFASNVLAIGEILQTLPAAGSGLGAIAVLIGAFHLWRRVESSDDPALRGAAQLTALYPFVFLLGIAFTHRLGDPHFFYWSRYVYPVIPLLLVLFSVGITTLVVHTLPSFPNWRAQAGETERASDGRPVDGVTARRAAGVLALACALPPLLLTPGRTVKLAETFAWNSQNMEEVQVAIGRWLRDHTPQSAVVATVDSGAVRYYGERTTLDLAGLNSHRLLSNRRETLARMAPRYMVTFPKTTDPLLVARLGLVELFRASSRHYTVSPAHEQSSLAVYEITNPAGMQIE